MSRIVTSSDASATARKYRWYRELNSYHWLALSVTCLGWMFDTMAQQLFSLARKPAIAELMGGHASDAAVSEQAGYATMIFMMGWGLGGLLFGVLGDRLGRVKTMMLTVLAYTIFTGASMAAVTVWQFHAFRFLCGLGVGGQFAVGVALVAEVIPARARPYALGVVQASSSVGNMLAALTGILLGQLQQAGSIAGAWRYLFLAGAAPAPLAIVILRKLKEPEQWLNARAQKARMGS
ncbi:MAG: MFS transporter, partial [Acidobacteriaceae bacterium]|nr:MFS transporter [Acidobacteriaceae bacterium]